MSLQEYEHKLSRLPMNTRGGGGTEKSPHKVVLLLAVMDLVDRYRPKADLNGTPDKVFGRIAVLVLNISFMLHLIEVVLN